MPIEVHKIYFLIMPIEVHKIYFRYIKETYTKNSTFSYLIQLWIYNVKCKQQNNNRMLKAKLFLENPYENTCDLTCV